MKNPIKHLFWRRLSDLDLMMKGAPRGYGVVTRMCGDWSVWAVFPVFLVLRWSLQLWRWLISDATKREIQIAREKDRAYERGFIAGKKAGEEDIHGRMTKQLGMLEQKNRKREAETYANKGK